MSDLSGLNANEAIAAIRQSLDNNWFHICSKQEFYLSLRFEDKSKNSLILEIYLSNAGHTQIEITSHDGSDCIGRPFPFKEYDEMNQQIRRILEFLMDYD